MATAAEIQRVAKVGRLWGLKIPTEPVCCGHTAPGEFAAMWLYDRPSVSLVHGARGTGKSLLAGMVTHLDSLQYRRLSTRILGGSMAQSEQIYDALKIIQSATPQFDPFESLSKVKAVYFNDSDVAILAASAKQVRGPHIPVLRLDEVDEIDSDVRESAMPMAMERDGVPAMIAMTSTWHRLGGPMSELIKRGQERDWPIKTFCCFDVLERCPESRSGPATGDERVYEGCPDCPIQKWCHADIATTGVPKAKRSCGHYKIDGLITQAAVLSDRRFESDLLCMRPRAEGMWFSQFDRTLHVKESAEYNRNLPFHVAIDPGVHTAAVWFQKAQSWDGTAIKINVFGDYYCYDESAQENARKIIQKTIELTGVGVGYGKVSMDSACKQKTAVGPTVRAEYVRAGCIGSNGELSIWPAIGQGRPKADELALIEALLHAADGSVNMTIHPRCEYLVDSLETYVRKKGSDGNFTDEPESPQHPAENGVDALGGGLITEFPSGRLPAPVFRTVDARSFL